METRSILIIEDDMNSATVISRILNQAGYQTNIAGSAEAGLEKIRKESFDLLIIDLLLPGMDGLTFLKEVKQSQPEIQCVIVTSYGTIRTAVESLKMGAADFLEKPIIPEKLLHVLQKAFEEKRLREEITALRSDLSNRYRFDNIIGKHPDMRLIFQTIESVAVTEASVLITGETGTGKDLVARAIHYHSQRKNNPFIPLNCASVPETLLESELFGYEKGAFTGAMNAKSGKLEQAEGGSVFLDEIGDMPLTIQGKLLRAIQEKKIEHLGSTRHRPLKLDIRFICATNKDLTYEIKHHRFRLDLFYRLNVVPINIPPLRRRQDDIPLLVDHFLEKLSKEKKTQKPKLSEKAVGQLMEHSWPGNVRELENVLERSMILSPGPFIDDINLCHDIDEPGKQKPSPVPSIDLSVPLKVMKEQAVSRIEAEYLSALLKKYDGSIKRTAAHADIDVRTIRRKMKTYGLDKWSFKTD